jgi:curli biogenesis system outer membrane secretion channel CsgG
VIIVKQILDFGLITNIQNTTTGFAMYRRLWIIALTAMLSLTLLTATSAQAKKKAAEKPEKEPHTVSIAVFNFSDAGTQAPGVGRAVAEMLIGRLAGDKVFRIFERDRLNEIMEEQNRSNPSDNEGNSLRAGRTAGVQFMLLGKVSEFGISNNSILIPGQGTVTKYKARVSLDIRVALVSNAQVLKTWNASGSETSFNLGVDILGLPSIDFAGSAFNESLLGKATRKAVNSAADAIIKDFRGEELQKAAGAMQVSGLVADVDGNNVIINIGQAAGAKAGQTLEVYRVVKEVRDPDTGELLTEKRKLVGQIFVTHVEDKYSEAAISETAPGEEIMKSDVVVEEKKTK